MADDNQVRIVAWLRQRGSDFYADCIERGEHLVDTGCIATTAIAALGNTIHRCHRGEGHKGDHQHERWVWTNTEPAPAVGDLVRVTRATVHDGASVGVEALLYHVFDEEPRYRLAHVGYAADVEVVERGGGDWLSRVRLHEAEPDSTAE